ncbi:unnamed protein product [Brachionus calyciflorus]|uniref:Uncharacterized protein n=1 Tax=Brachionus calyciflorus TaxID=104777 RepID=A0A814RX91_9BILA|nr:unnamed protein product [Brachionus calyciflorus]
MHKMRTIKSDENFTINDLINYINCKNNGFENNSNQIIPYIKNQYFTSETDAHWNRKNNKQLDNYNYSKNSFQNHQQHQNNNQNWKNTYQKNDFQAPKQQQEQQQAPQVSQQTQQKTKQKESKLQKTETVLNKDSKRQRNRQRKIALFLVKQF